MKNTLPQLYRISLSSNGLKLIACFSMLIDHIGLILLPQYVFLRWIGRIAFPIFAYMLGQGMLHTRNYKNYLFRLVLFAIIFQKPYCYCTNLTDINIFGELALGLIAIYAYEQLFKQQRPLLAWLPALIFGIMAQLWNFQYGLYGIALLITGYVFADQQWKLSAAWLFINSIPLWGLLDMGNSQILSLLALPLIFVYNGNRGRGNKWLFYGFYCLHIPALWLINIYLH